MMQEIKDEEIKKDKQEVENEPGLFNAGSASAGPMLRAARKDKAMSVEDVSEELNLSNNVVDAIENDSWEHLPEATYVRGYIRSYARLLGLDPADVLMSFRYNNSEQNISLDSMPRKIEDRKISFSIPGKVKILLLIAAIGGVVAYLYNDQAMNLLESKIDKVTESNAENNPEKNTVNNEQITEKSSETASTVNEIKDNGVAASSPSKVAAETTDVTVAEGEKELLEL